MMTRTSVAALVAGLFLAGGCSSITGAPSEIGAPVSAFAPPTDDRPSYGIDYKAYGELLDVIVFDVGPSDRKPAARPKPMTGSRISRYNTSRYRLEANRIVFSIQPRALEQVTSEIVDGFEQIANSSTFDQMNADEQLAFWLNFHNALLIEQMAAQYPFQRMNALKAVGSAESVYNAKLITVNGIPLSLNDIKYRIVYPYWRDPMVMYGFYTGAIGGPSIRKAPYTASTINSDLASNAREFVNSLRGVEIDDDETRISRLYKDSLVLFPGGLTAAVEHMRRFANAPTKESLNPDRPIRADVWDPVIADVSYGDMPPPITNMQVLDGGGLRGVLGGVGLTPQGEEFVREIETRKFNIFRERGGTVTIDDEPLDAEPIDAEPIDVRPTERPDDDDEE